MDTLEGSVERITFYNPENGYSVLRLQVDKNHHRAADKEGLVTVTGNLPEIAPGEYLRIQGDWATHPQYGQQFHAQIVQQVAPATVEGIKRYLGSGLLEGIGPKLAARIVDHFGENTLVVIDQTPHKLRQVPDIGPKRVHQIVAAWQEQKLVKDIMLFLHTHGVSTNLAVKIYKQYGDAAMQIVQSDPYQLARDMFGVGFKTADKIARDLGLPKDHTTRIEAGIVYLLEEMLGEGHVFLPWDVLITKAAGLLGVSEELLPSGIESMGKAELVVVDEMLIMGESQTAVYLSPYYYAEKGVTERLKVLVNKLPSNLSDVPPLFVNLDESLSPEQDHAIRIALSNPVSIITGGPGTGKTTAIRALIVALESAKKRFALASPTGRAAKRLSEATGKPASTIHRLLEFSPRDGFNYQLNNPLPIDLLVVDEVSMLDLILANNLLKALAPGTHLVLVGDVDQLPSVGAGDILRDVITSELVPVTTLSQIFRQAAGSLIITNAHLINHGKIPDFSTSGDDFFLFPAETPEKAAEWVVDLVTQRIPQKFGLGSNDIQVLVPMYRGPAGITALNTQLQNALNPSNLLKPERTLFGQTFRPGDKIMQVRNDYEKLVFNGDIGTLKEIDNISKTMTTEFEGRNIAYDWSEADQLVLAYAISVHKSQGSEFPAIILPLLTQHYMMLQRNLLYTAITRAKQLCVLVGSRKAIAIAVKNNQEAQRWTGLAERLGRKDLDQKLGGS